MVIRNIYFNRLSIGKKLEFNRYLMTLNYSVLKGGDHNHVFLEFEDEQSANKFMYAFIQQIKKVRGIFAYEDKNGNIHLKYKTKLDFYG